MNKKTRNILIVSLIVVALIFFAGQLGLLATFAGSSFYSTARWIDSETLQYTNLQTFEGTILPLHTIDDGFSSARAGQLFGD